MKIQALHACTVHTIRGHYWRTFQAALLCPSVWLILRTLPLLLAAVLIRSESVTAKMLLTDAPQLWMGFTVLWMLFRFGIFLPLRCASDGWMLSRFGLFPDSGDAVCFRSARAYFRAFRFFLCIGIVRMLKLLPCLAGFTGAVLAFGYSINRPDGILPLFLAVQCLCIGIFAGISYLRFCLGMGTVRLLFLRNPDMSPITAIRRSACVLRGKRLTVLLLRMCRAAAFLILPLLPYTIMYEILFLELSIREQEQREEFHHARPILYHESPAALSA